MHIIFFSESMCVSENRFSEPSKYLEGNSLKCTVIYIDSVNLWHMLISSFLFSQSKSQTVCPKIGKIFTNRTASVFLSFSSVSVKKNDS